MREKLKELELTNR